jgi:TolA-binding protein
MPDRARSGRATFILLALLLGMTSLAPGVATRLSATDGAADPVAAAAAGGTRLQADLGLAQARIRYLGIEIAALEHDLQVLESDVAGGEGLRRTLERLRRQLLLLEHLTTQISRTIPTQNQS